MKKIFIISMLALLFMSSLSTAQEPTKEEGVKNIDYSLWSEVLETYVNNQGKVNYKALKNNPKKLDQFIQYIEKIDADVLESSKEKKAFWINAYNALTLQTIIDNYPVKSIRLISFGLVWKLPKKVAQKKMSLEHIEHKIIRKMNDPRIHFALNCASIGCPKLPNEPFYPDQLDQQLDKEAKRFMNDEEKVYLNRITKILYHSELLNWYESDFLIETPDKLSYIVKYLNSEDQKFLKINKIKLEKIKYDWGLNEQ